MRFTDSVSAAETQRRVRLANRVRDNRNRLADELVTTSYRTRPSYVASAPVNVAGWGWTPCV